MIFDKFIHLPNLILFPIINKDKEIYDNFQYRGYYHEINHDENIKFAKKIFGVINKKNLDNIIQDIKKKNSDIYSINIFDKIDQDSQKEIKNFFDKKQRVKKISDMLGYRVKLRNVSLIVNFFNEYRKKIEGSKMYHRDSDSLNDQVKIFMLLNNIDENTGMFYFVPKYLINEDYRLPFEKDRINLDIWDKWRNYDKTVLSAIQLKKPNTDPNLLVKKLEGKAGETLYIDTGKIYHKGGFVNNQNNMRVLLQAVYTPILSLSDWNRTSKFKIIKNITNKLTTLRIKLRKLLIL